MNVAIEEHAQATRTKGRPWMILVIALAVAVFALDQFAKTMVIQNLSSASGPRSVEVLGDVLRFTYTTNSGAVFGILPNATYFLAAIAIIAVPALLFLQRYLPSNVWVAHIAVGLLVGGTLGNLFDRLRFGYVIDFIDAGIGTLRWYTFNIADASYIIGVLILAVYILFFSEMKPKQNNAA